MFNEQCLLRVELILDDMNRLGLLSRRLALLIERHTAVHGVRSVLEALREQIGESVSFCVLDRTGIWVEHVEVVQSEKVVRYVIAPGTRRPLYCSSPGQILLAWQAPADVDRYLSRVKLDRLTPNTIVSRDQLLARLRDVRNNGFVVIDSEMTPDVVGAAVPVFDADGQVLAALAMGAPQRRGASHIDEYVAALRRSAAQLSAV